MLDIALTIALGMVAISQLLCVYRLLRGPDAPDRILALDTLYINAIGMLVLLDIKLGTQLLFEAGLLIAVMGFVSTLALTRYITRGNIIE